MDYCDLVIKIYSLNRSCIEIEEKTLVTVSNESRDKVALFMQTNAL